MKKGFSTIELLIAFAVAMIFLTGCILLAFGGQSTGLDTMLTNRGLSYASSKIGETISTIADTWGTTVSAETEDIYDFTGTISEISPCVKLIETNTGWTTEKNRTQGITFGAVVSNIEEAIALGGDCDSHPAGSTWDEPISYGSADVGGSEGTDIAARSISGDPYAFVTASPAAVAKEDFVVTDVSDPEHPSVIAKINTGKGLNSVAVANGYAYVLQEDDTNQLQVINISNPSSPVLSGTAYTLPNITCAYNANTCQRRGRSIAYYDGYVYISTGYMAGNSPEFHIYCVDDSSVAGCSPSTPVWRGSLNVNHNINDIAVKGDYAYLATSADYGELTMIDVTNKTSPQLPPNYTSTPNDNNKKYNALTTVGGASDEDGRSVYVLGNYIYLGRDRVAATNKRDFYILNVSDPSAITAAGSVRLGISNNSYVSGIIRHGSHAFVATTDSNEPLFIFNVSNISNPIPQSSCGLNFSQVTRALVYYSDMLLTVNRSNDLIRIIYDEPDLTCS